MLRKVLINVAIFWGIAGITWLAAYFTNDVRLAGYMSDLMLAGLPFAIAGPMIYHHIKKKQKSK